MNSIKKALLTVLLLLVTTMPILAQQPAGTQTGLGIIYDPDTPYIVPPRSLQVVGVFKNSPAYQNLHLYDFISKINGKDIVKMTPGEIEQILSAPQPVTLTVTRDNAVSEVTLTPAQYVSSPDNIAESVYPVGCFKGFESENYFRSSLTSGDRVRVGDSFTIYDGDTVLGTARVRETNSSFSYLLITETKGKIDSTFQYRYRLVYSGFFPPTGRHFTPEEMKMIEDWKKTQWAAYEKRRKAEEASKPKVESSMYQTSVYSPLDTFPNYDYSSGYYYHPYRYDMRIPPVGPITPYYPPSRVQPVGPVVQPSSGRYIPPPPPQGQLIPYSSPFLNH